MPKDTVTQTDRFIVQFASFVDGSLVISQRGDKVVFCINGKQSFTFDKRTATEISDILRFYIK